VHDVLEPVRWLYERTNVYMQRRIAHEVERQLWSGIDATPLRQRLTNRRAQPMTDEIRDPDRWLLGVALPAWGCGLFDCEAGVLWSSGRRCSLREKIIQDGRRTAAPSRTPARSRPPAGQFAASASCTLPAPQPVQWMRMPHPAHKPCARGRAVQALPGRRN